jgi:hypothetical protein
VVALEFVVLNLALALRVDRAAVITHNLMLIILQLLAKVLAFQE